MKCIDGEDVVSRWSVVGLWFVVLERRCASAVSSGENPTFKHRCAFDIFNSTLNYDSQWLMRRFPFDIGQAV